MHRKLQTQNPSSRPVMVFTKLRLDIVPSPSAIFPKSRHFFGAFVHYMSRV